MKAQQTPSAACLLGIYTIQSSFGTQRQGILLHGDEDGDVREGYPDNDTGKVLLGGKDNLFNMEQEEDPTG